MKSYETYQRRAVGLAFILGPLLLTVGAVVYLLGIERGPAGTGSWVEGVFVGLSMLIFVPICFDLSRLLGQRAPRFGIACAVTGLGMGLLILPGVARIAQVEIIQAGLNESIWSIQTHPGRIPLLLWGMLGMFTSLFLGIGFLWKGGLPRWTAVLLILAPVLFTLGQADDESIAQWRVNIFYPLACLTWLIALGSIGWRRLFSERSELVSDLETSAAIS